jgi:hypothetical protein
MLKIIPVFVFSLIMMCVFTGCHAAQEKAWNTALETTRQKISEDEFLKKNVERIELERRQFIRVYIVPQGAAGARSNFALATIQVAQIFGDLLFADPGNTFKEITVFGNVVDGDELIVCKYTKDGGAKIEKDRSVQTM